VASPVASQSLQRFEQYLSIDMKHENTGKFLLITYHSPPTKNKKPCIFLQQNFLQSVIYQRSSGLLILKTIAARAAPPKQPIRYTHILLHDTIFMRLIPIATAGLNAPLEIPPNA
jgi:hypothetical protein